MTDLNSVDRAKTELTQQILAAEAAPDRIENPISTALDLKALRQSTDPVASFWQLSPRRLASLGRSSLPYAMIFGFSIE